MEIKNSLKMKENPISLIFVMIKKIFIEQIEHFNENLVDFKKKLEVQNEKISEILFDSSPSKLVKNKSVSSSKQPRQQNSQNRLSSIRQSILISKKSIQ